MTTFTAEQAIQTLVAEGYDPADVQAAFDSMVDAGFELDQPDQGYMLTEEEVDMLRTQVGPDRSDIIAALREADIEYRVEHPRTENEGFQVTRSDGRVIAFGAEAGGINIAWYRTDVDSDVTSQDYVRSTAELVEILRIFLAA